MINYLIWALVAILYAPLFKQLYNPVWNGLKRGPLAFFNAFGEPWGRIADYTHAYFILPIVLWIIWRNRSRIKANIQNRKIGSSKNLLGFPILVLGILMLIFGLHQEYLFISTLSLIPFLIGLIIFLYGTSSVKIFFFPVFYLLFLVPPPFAVLDSITLPMRQGVSALTEVILVLFNYPITRDGLLLSIGYFEIFMGQPCSGFRSLVTMFALVLVYVYISRGSLAKKIILASFIVPIAILGNLVRVITLCLITYYFGEETGQGFFHNFSGIMIFIITILGILGLETILDKRMNRVNNKI